MLYTPLTKKALRIMFETHKEQKDKGDMPYVFHPYEVASKMEDEASVCVALLHDVVEDKREDIEIALRYLEGCGFPEEVIEAVLILTRPQSLSYKKYIQRIKSNPLAVKVKIADLRHNLDISRLNNPSEEDLARIRKYKEALNTLGDVNERGSGIKCQDKLTE